MKTNKPHYTIFHSDAEEGLHLVDSLIARDDCTSVKFGFRGDKNPILHLIRRVHTSYRLNQIIPLPFRYIWYDFCYRKFDDPENEIVVMHTFPFYKYDVKSFFKKWNKKNIKTYVVFVDSVDTDYAAAKVLKDILKIVPGDHIFSFDMGDCKKYGLNYLNECYNDTIAPKVPAKPKYDLYLVATVKPNRTEVVNRLYDKFIEHGIKAKLDFVAIPDINRDYYKNPDLRKEIKVYDHHLAYSDVLKNSANSNCIMEISQPGQNAPSLRYFESVLLNKKLLTNVKNTKKLNFYNPKFMKITDYDEKNIDFDWIKKREKINYHYKGEFKSANLINMIEKIEKTK